MASGIIAIKMSMKNEHELSKSVKHVLAKDKTTQDCERRLYMLLVDHPDFVVNVKRIRKDLYIPHKGFMDSKKAFDWEHQNRDNKTKLWNEVEEIVSEFKIKRSFAPDAKFFVYNSVNYETLFS